MVLVVLMVLMLVLMLLLLLLLLALLLHARAGTADVDAAMTGVAFAALDRALSGYPHKCGRAAAAVSESQARKLAARCAERDRERERRRKLKETR